MSALRPPPGGEGVRWHWLRDNNGRDVVALWLMGCWWLPGVGERQTPDYLAGRKYEYIGPCLPIDPDDPALVEIAVNAVGRRRFGDEWPEVRKEHDPEDSWIYGDVRAVLAAIRSKT